jgi:hypothetical protein
MIEMRGMNKEKIEAFLISGNPDWVYIGFDRSVNKHIWTLKKTEETSVMVLFNPEFGDFNKQYIHIITGDSKINTGIMEQITKYKMKKIYFNTESVVDDNGIDSTEMLTEVYEGAKYKITLLKMHDNKGGLTISTLLEKK